MKKYFISTAIPYVNGKPHIGHALEYVQTDTLARYHKLLGKDVFFLTGADENSLKNVLAAEKEGREVSEYVSDLTNNFIKLRDSLNIDYDSFIKTSDKKHHLGAQKLWSLLKKEDLEKRKYKGLYCVGCEAFYKEEDLVDGKCPEHKTEPEVVEEENWFFKLSNYSEKLKELIEKDILKITPEFRKNEWLAFIERGLEDFSISRSKERAKGWGVEVPGDEDQIMYVWVDALSNYITGLGFGSDDESNFEKYWVQKDSENREVVHVIGKGIAKFHVLYWIGLLLSADLPLPTEEFIHGYLTIEGEKISKSLGNVIEPNEVVEKYGIDAVRYYLLGAVSSTNDGDFSTERFEEYYTAHLVNGIGNLTFRILSMLEKYNNNKILKKTEIGIGGLKEELSGFWNDDLGDRKGEIGYYRRSFENYNFNEVIRVINNFVSKCDTFISETEPWKKAKAGEDISGLLYYLAEGLRQIAIALLPIIPESANKILQGLNYKLEKDFEEEIKWGGLKEGTEIKKGDILFPRLNKN